MIHFILALVFLSKLFISSRYSAVTVLQTENLGLNVLKMHFSKTVTTITAIQTETAAVDGEMTSFVHKITP